MFAVCALFVCTLMSNGMSPMRETCVKVKLLCLCMHCKLVLSPYVHMCASHVTPVLTRCAR